MTFDYDYLVIGSGFAGSVSALRVAAGGRGAGDGSLVWGAVMLESKSDFHRDPQLAAQGVNWSDELGPHFDIAKRMRGVAVNPKLPREA